MAEDAKPKAKPKVTAFVLDPEHVQASGDGMTVPPLPGLWTNDTPIHPEALGLTVSEMRDAIEALSLPLKEVKVAESKAVTSFAKPDYLLPSAPLSIRGRGATVTVAEPDAESADEIGSEHVDTTVLEEAVHDEEGGSE